jgi:hypothetical protein
MMDKDRSLLSQKFQVSVEREVVDLGTEHLLESQY